MDVSIRRAAPDDFDALIDRDLQAFSGSYTPEQRAAWRDLLDLDRFTVAHDGAQLVGAAGSYEFELTLPGGAAVPMGGTTWVSVAPTHRRRGIVRRLLAEVHADMDRRAEPIAGLLASEGSIYERFGYGVATRWRSIELDARQATLVDPPDDALRMVAPADHLDELSERYERYRSVTPGEVSRPREMIAVQIAELKQPFCALHDDGYVVWTVEGEWGLSESRRTLTVRDLVASTPEAHAALWNLVLSVDLVRTVVASSAEGLDGRLSYLLSDQRAVRTKDVHDLLWLRPNHVGELLASRRYRIDDEMVVEVVDEGGDVGGVERWRVSGGPDGAVCDATDATPDLTMSRSAMGSLLLGGISASELAGGGRLTGATGQLGRADAFFGWSPAPHCTTAF